MKNSKFFTRLLFAAATVVLLACGSDDNGESPAVDIEAVYSVSTAKEIKDYTSGESLATVTDGDGAITAASLGSGSTLPAGTALNASTGAITVSDVASLEAGSYSLSITTEDSGGGTTDHTITIVLSANSDAAALYTIVEAKAIQDYTMGESIATVTDADGDIVAATLENGSELPAGTALNGTTGELIIEDSALLTPGSYEITINTADSQGGATTHMITVVFNPNPDVDSIYTVADAKSIEDYETDESIAIVTDENGAISSAILESGSELPLGTALNAMSGEITVSDPTLLVPGTYNIEITTEDEFAGTTTNTVTLVFNENPLRVNINAGGEELTFENTTFSADQFFVGSSMPFTPNQASAIENTDNDELYITERFGTDFGYEIELENGTYKVVLHFVELFWGAPGNGAAGGSGDRLFDVSLEGVVVVNDYDIFEEVGALSATQKEFEVTLADGMLNIDFSASADNAKISALEIEKID